MKELKQTVQHHPERTLSATLTMLNLTHESSGKSNGKRRILSQGEPVFVGDCTEVWAWLVETGQLKGFDLSEVQS